MKFIRKMTYNLPDLEYFRNKFNWDDENMSQVIETLGLCDESVLQQFLGFEIAYDYYVEDD